jgi:hypothetical protein
MLIYPSPLQLISHIWLIIYIQADTWLLHPINGTEGSLYERQYSLHLMLIMDTQVQLSIFDRSNPPHDPVKPSGESKRRCFFAVARRGEGQVRLISLLLPFMETDILPTASFLLN